MSNNAPTFFSRQPPGRHVLAKVDSAADPKYPKLAPRDHQRLQDNGIIFCDLCSNASSAELRLCFYVPSIWPSLRRGARPNLMAP